LIPKGRYGCILSISRSLASDDELADAGSKVLEMKKDEAVQFLLECSRHVESENDKHHAKALVQVLGYLPLAIEQAGCHQGVCLTFQTIQDSRCIVEP
jgi:hypothetical protein